VSPELAAFRNSLEALAQIAVRATGARSFALIKSGAARSDAGTPALLEYPLRTDSMIVASVAFAFDSDAEAMRAKPRLERIAAAMQAIWGAATEDRYARLVDRLSHLESRLVDSKIADRARGLLTDEPVSDPIEAIARHVDGVLRPTSTSRFLEQALSELEDEIEERRLVAEAKQILQAFYRISEEQAHHQLRLLSRKSRKPLKNVAQQVIENRQLVKGISA